MDRNQIIKGPAVVIRGTHTYFTREDITLKANKETYSIPSNILGSAGKRVTSKSFTVSFVPQGMLDVVEAYFPWTLANLGASIFGANDTTLVIHTLSGRKLTFAASGNLGVRTIHCGTDATALGEISFLCLGALNTADSTSSSRFTVEEAAFAATGYDRNKIRTPGYQATLVVGVGETAVTTVMQGLEGFDINLEPSFDSDIVNAYGLVGQTHSGIAASALFKPCNMTEAAVLGLLNLQGTGCQEIGDDLGPANATLTIAPINPNAKGVTGILYGVGAGEAEFKFGLKQKRVQGVKFEASPILDTTFKLFSIAFPSWTVPA